jgi:hypothetical protein
MEHRENDLVCPRSARTIVNVGVGAGAYEPPDGRIVAVKHSERVIQLTVWMSGIGWWSYTPCDRTVANRRTGSPETEKERYAV